MDRAQQRLIFEKRGPIDLVTLNRPEVLNALDDPLIDDLHAYFTGLQTDHSVRLVILQGNGRGFCAGLDLKALPAAAPEVAALWQRQRRIAEIISMMRNVPQPIIALAQGAAAGGGFSLLLASDVRIAAADLRMNAAYIRIGLGGCDIGSSYLLPRLVGSSIASELLLTGRFLDAERALRLGLVSNIVPHEQLLEAGLAMAADMLRNTPMGVRLTKQVLNINIDAQSLDAAIALEDRQQVMLIHTSDHREGAAAFLQKRTPIFQDR